MRLIIYAKIVPVFCYLFFLAIMQTNIICRLSNSVRVRIFFIEFYPDSDLFSLEFSIFQPASTQFQQCPFAAFPHSLNRRQRRFYSSGSDADLVVIGSGPGGYVAAIKAAQLGMNVSYLVRTIYFDNLSEIFEFCCSLTDRLCREKSHFGW